MTTIPITTTKPYHIFFMTESSCIPLFLPQAKKLLLNSQINNRDDKIPNHIKNICGRLRKVESVNSSIPQIISCKKRKKTNGKNDHCFFINLKNISCFPSITPSHFHINHLIFFSQ